MFLMEDIRKSLTPKCPVPGRRRDKHTLTKRGEGEQEKTHVPQWFLVNDLFSWRCFDLITHNS